MEMEVKAEREREWAVVVEPTYYMKRCFVPLGFDSDSGEDLAMKMHCFNAKPCISFLIFPKRKDPFPTRFVVTLGFIFFPPF